MVIIVTGLMNKKRREREVLIRLENIPNVDTISRSRVDVLGRGMRIDTFLRIGMREGQNGSII